MRGGGALRPRLLGGFHSNNGSEYINHHVPRLLNKLLIEEQTKSRSRHSNDNAQAESKNGAIVRKHLGYNHIPQRFAGLVNAFCRDHLNPYVNFHRPCLFAEIITDAKGCQRKRYPYKLMIKKEIFRNTLGTAERNLISELRNYRNKGRTGRRSPATTPIGRSTRPSVC